MHPSDEIRGVKSKRLCKKRIVLGVTGSIAAIESVGLSRELIRHGAEVYPVMTSSATRIIHPDSLEFASGNKPIITLTGKTEHVSFCGKVKNPVDLLLISPCTANTISKIAMGIDDTSVTTFATTALGSGIPLLIVPAMHISMYNHKIVQKNIMACKQLNIEFVEPLKKDNKAKMASIENIVSHVNRKIGKQDMINKRILIIGGSSAESIDDVRIITNRSSGKTAINLAKSAFYRGANVELWYGCSKETVPNYIKNVRFESVFDIVDLLKKRDLKKFDIIIVCAALSDFIPEKKIGKITSDRKQLNLNMKSAPKIITELKSKSPNSKIVGFKLEESSEKISVKASRFLHKDKLDFVVANTISNINSAKGEYWIIDKKNKIINIKGYKDNLSDSIYDIII